MVLFSVCRGAMSNYLYYSLSMLHFLIMLLFEPCALCIGNDTHLSKCVYRNEFIKYVILHGFIQVCDFSLHSLPHGEHTLLSVWTSLGD